MTMPMPILIVVMSTGTGGCAWRSSRKISCRSQNVVHEGHVIGGGGMLKTAQRCEVCHAMFWFVRRRAPVAVVP